MRHLILSLFVLCPVLSRAALITTHTDAGGSGGTVNGSIAANEYGPGNSYAFTGGGTGFFGQLGPATLYMKSDGAFLYVGFSNLGVPGDGNQYLVYFNTRPGGYQPNGEMTDTNSGGRANISRMSTNGVETVTFSNGVESGAADFALLFYNNNAGFTFFCELSPGGQTHVTLPHTIAGLGTSSPEFRFALSDLALAPGGSIDFAAFEISTTGYLSNEGIPNLNLSSNIGFGAGQTNVFPDFHRFVPLVAGPAGPLTNRVGNITLRMPQQLPSQTPVVYATTNAFPGLSFANPLWTAVPPGETNRLFVGELAGVVQVITNLAAPTKTTFLNISSRVNTASEGGLLALAFHPGYATNRRFFVFYTVTANNGTGNGFHTRVAEFQTSATNANFSPTNEIVLFSQYNEAANHNAGDLAFGPDGYLYITTGDEGGGDDFYNNSQRIDKDFFSSILRIDVDKKPGSLPPNHHPAIAAPTNYAIPPDNPFIGATQFNGSAVNSNNVRTEFWAVGLRNPFRFAFDEVTGELYAGDVGQNAREEVDLIRKGGNYGWKWREGKIATPTVSGSPPSGFTNWINPLLDYTRGSATNQGTSITGGRVFRGNRFPELVGRYLFADYNSGHIWSLAHDGTNSTSFTWHATDAGIVHFGKDPTNGDLLLCDLTGNEVKRLVAGTVSTSALPATLQDAGVFHDLSTLTPYAGIVAYDLNLPFWSDGALKRRWFSIPSTNLVITFQPDAPWAAPTSTVWIKHFDLLLTNGDSSSARRLETRLLVKNAGGSGGYGVTYRWGQSTTNAVLVPAAGLDEPFLINDGGTIRTQVWRYPSRAECLQCHNASAGFALGFNTAQLHRDCAFGPGDTTNQLRRWSDIGYFHTNIASVNLLRALAHPTNAAASIESRARSYLQANCANCHFPGGPVPAAFDTRLYTALSSAAIVNGALANNFGDPNNVVVRPGILSNSMAHTRLSFRGAGQMPPLASSVVDTQGLALVAAWIGALSGYQTFSEWQIANFGSTTNAGAGPDEDFDGDGAPNRLEYLARTDPTNAASFWFGAEIGLVDGSPRLGFEQLANRGHVIQAATSLTDGAWTTLDIPENRPAFTASDAWVELDAPADTNAAGLFYRVNLYEP